MSRDQLLLGVCNAVAVATWALLVAGCADLTGLGASAAFQCSAPRGLPCRSLAAVAAPAASAAWPGWSGPGRVARPPAQLLPAGALRSEPTVVRLWIAPWVDRDGDLHDQSHVYLQIDTGRWLVDHTRERVRRGFAPQAEAVPQAAAGPASGPSPAPRPGGGLRMPLRPDGAPR